MNNMVTTLWKNLSNPNQVSCQRAGWSYSQQDQRGAACPCARACCHPRPSHCTRWWSWRWHASESCARSCLWHQQNLSTEKKAVMSSELITSSNSSCSLRRLNPTSLPNPVFQKMAEGCSDSAAKSVLGHWSCSTLPAWTSRRSCSLLQL